MLFYGRLFEGFSIRRRLAPEDDLSVFDREATTDGDITYFAGFDEPTTELDFKRLWATIYDRYILGTETENVVAARIDM